MAKPLVFMMGRSPAFLPIDRRYARNHMWAVASESGYRLGLSAYAVRLIGDVSHLNWSVQPGDTIQQGGQIGFIEGSKATSDLYSPLAGIVDQINSEVVAKPTLVNSNLYDSGWLLDLRSDETSLMSPEQYLAHLEAAWPLAQRLLKGQAGGK